jgi:Flp pilus assembly protein TadG
MYRRVHFGSRGYQQGAALILVVVGMVALLLMAGLALDGGHVFLNKTRLQNTVDAAALSAAKTLDDTKGNTTAATAAAMAAFNSNAAAYGNVELERSYGGGSGTLTVTVQYSATLRPFTPGSTSGPYVRVIAASFTMPAWLVNLVGITEKTVAATAVAGPSPTLNQQVCNLAPMMVCGDPSQDPKAPGGDPDNFWGYEQGAPDVLKTAASGHWEGTPGPGNFQLIRLGGAGAAIVRENMAGDYAGCASVGDTIETEPGNTVGPVAQGLNTRFGQYAGPMGGTQDQYPPDVITDAQDPQLEAGEDPVTGEDTVLQNGQLVTMENVEERLFDYEEYKAALNADPSTYDNAPPEGEFERRKVTIPVGDCSITTNGHGYVPVLGFACFFLLQPAKQKGNEAHVFGQFVGDCTVNGMPGTTPGTGPEPYRIQLYDDPDSKDS